MGINDTNLGGNSEKLTSLEISPMNNTAAICISDIMQKYYSEAKELVYIAMDPDGKDLLKVIHSLGMFTIGTTNPANVPVTSMAYLIVAKDVPEFVLNVIYLNQESSWNPYARFLVFITNLARYELRQVFDLFLFLHVNDVVVVNGTQTAELYTYNPYDEFACGKYYTKIIKFGKCLDVTANIYPQKVTTGLRNCFFNVSVPHWPPYGMNPSDVKDGSDPIGTEQYIFNLISEIEHFSYKFNFNYDPELFSIVSENRSVTGPMLKLKNNQTDVMLGGLMLIPSRAQMFFYINGYLDFEDEIRFMVKRAGATPTSEGFYLEFTPAVWVLLLLTLILYSAFVVILVGAEDNGFIVLTLLNYLLSHGSKFWYRRSVRRFFIVWVWFAYIINCFYTSHLMSFTMKPSMNYQIRDEQAVKDHVVESCLSTSMEEYIKSQSNNNDILKNANSSTNGCKAIMDSIKSVSESYRLFTIAFDSIYTFNKYQFYDEYGNSPIYTFSKPYAKVIYAMYFNKGFPMSNRLHLLALRIRETGLVEKNLKNHYFNQKIKYHFRSQGFEARLMIPWHLYFVGVFISSVIFVVELASQYKNVKIAHADE